MTTMTRNDAMREKAAWKGTVLMMGLLALLLLLNGCYTVLARGGAAYGDLAQAAYEPTRPDQGSWQYDDAPTYEQSAYADESVGVGYEGYGAEAASGVGVRYRMDYGEDQGLYETYRYEEPLAEYVSYQRPWVRRVHVDWYLHSSQRVWPWPRRIYRGWSVGATWGGFHMAYGSWEPWWYDPFYWDAWWCEPYWPSYGVAVYTYDPWWDTVVYTHWRNPWWDPYCNPWWRPRWYDYEYAWYHPWYMDGGWYGPYVPRVVAVTDYERRPDGRRRGLTAIQDARSGRGASGDDTGSSARRGTAVRDARAPTGTTSRGGTDPRITTARNPRTGATGGTSTGASRPTGSGGSAVRGARGGTTGSSGGTTSRVRRPPPIDTATVRIGTTTNASKKSSAVTEARKPNGGETAKKSSTVIKKIGGLIGGAVTRKVTTPTRRTTTSRPPARTTTSRPPTRTTTSRPPTRTTTAKPPTRTTTAKPPTRTTTSRPPTRTTTRKPPPKTTSSRTRRPPPEQE